MEEADPMEVYYSPTGRRHFQLKALGLVDRWKMCVNGSPFDARWVDALGRNFYHVWRIDFKALRVKSGSTIYCLWRFLPPESIIECGHWKITRALDMRKTWVLSKFRSLEYRSKRMLQA